MLVELTRVEPANDTIKVNRVYVNPAHVVSVVEDNLKYHSLKESLIEAGVHRQMSISEVKVLTEPQLRQCLCLVLREQSKKR